MLRQQKHFKLSGSSSESASSDSDAPTKNKRAYSSDEDDNEDPPNKKNSANFYSMQISNNETTPETVNNAQSISGTYNKFSMNIMKKMGFKEGEGLGKYGQGRTNIVEISKQRGRRGLGLHLEGLDPASTVWDSSQEEIKVEEEVKWIPSCTKIPPKMPDLRAWVKEGRKKQSIEDETQFCEPLVLKKIVNCKNVFDNLEPDEMRRARTRSNPFETIRGVIFQNRAAMKMANMDAVFDFMFTEPKDPNGKPLVGPDELLYFADVCAGPGGFSEYILWRKKWEAKGFGFTLKGPNDFKLEEFFAGPPETFEPHYGVDGINGDGDVYSPSNLREFCRFVHDSTEGNGVHFVMADGGFSVDGQENIQEILSKRLYLCQFLCALSILRTGGHFVCKVFDLFTSFSIGLIYLLYRAFEKVSIHKPNTSRPANSERYVVCKWRREDTKDIHDHLYEVNCRLGELSGIGCDNDVIEVVPLNMIIKDNEFFNYIVDSNIELGSRQIIHLAKIQAFARNTELYEDRQSELRSQCLDFWKIPDRARSAPTRPDPCSKFKELMKDENSLDYLSSRAIDLTLEKLESIRSVYDYRCIVSAVKNDGKNERCFILGLGKTNTYQWDGTSSCKWTKIEMNLELPAETLLYAEQVFELKGEGRAQQKSLALHVIDALFLGGKDVRTRHFTERINMARKLVKAVSKPTRCDLACIRMKQVYKLEDIRKVSEKLDMKVVKGGDKSLKLCYNMEEEHMHRQEEKRHYIPAGLLLIKTIEEPWMMAFSKTSQRKYLFHTQTRQSCFECPKNSISHFKSCFMKRIFWDWGTVHKPVNGVIQNGRNLNFSKPQNEDSSTKVDMDTFLNVINRLKGT